jgi:hypothetical protein
LGGSFGATKMQCRAQQRNTRDHLDKLHIILSRAGEFIFHRPIKTTDNNSDNATDRELQRSEDSQRTWGNARKTSQW